MRCSGKSLNGREVRVRWSATIWDVGTTRRPAFVPICQSRTEKSGRGLGNRRRWRGPKGSPADEVERGGGGVTLALFSNIIRGLVSLLALGRSPDRTSTCRAIGTTVTAEFFYQVRSAVCTISGK
jgi:hypothetical protein